MTVVTIPTFIQSGGEVAQDARRFLGGVFGHGGVIPRTSSFADLSVTGRASGGPNMSVDVAAGDCVVAGTESTSQGLYFCQNVGLVNVPISASDPTNPRWDLIVARVRDAAYSGATNTYAVERVGGTPAASPADPTVPANCVVLARVTVAAAASSISTGNCTDLRAGYLAVTGAATIGNQVKAANGVTLCTSTWRPTVSLYQGMIIYETDTKRVYIYSGSAWELFTSTPSTWTAPTLGNSWVNGGGAEQVCQYRKVGDMVQLRGFITSGTFNTTIFTLPTGFRPPAMIHVAAGLLAGTGWGRIDIAAAGTVVCDNTTVGTPTNGYLSLAGIEFSVTA